jgi:ankyrin repeat protein
MSLYQVLKKILYCSACAVLFFNSGCDTRPRESKILEKAASSGDTNTIHSFLNSGGDVETRVRLEWNPNVAWATMLHIAADNGQSETLSYLLSRGANPNSWYSRGWTPLFKAVGAECLSQKRIQCIKTLLRGGADINGTNRNGLTAADNAALLKRQDALDLLTKAGGIQRLRNGDLIE